MGHIGEADAETLVVGANERIRPLQIDVITDKHQRALRESEIDATRGVGEDHGFDTHTRKYANGERDLLGGITLVLMDAALHGGDFNCGSFANNEASGVSYRR